MKVLFIQESAYQDSIAIACLSGALKEAGHETMILFGSREPDLTEGIRRNSPDIVACSLAYGAVQFFRENLPKIRADLPNLPILIGGPLLDALPGFIGNLPMDYALRGEAEEAIVELVEVLSRGGDLNLVRGLSYRYRSTWRHNTARPVPENLDDLPLPDRNLVLKHSQVGRFPLKGFITGRGCPFDCKFCNIGNMKRQRPGFGRRIRKRSPQRLCQEIKMVMDSFPLSHVYFWDDLFFYGRDWLEEFFEVYPQTIGLPFFCHLSAMQLMNREVGQGLKECGCTYVWIGLETGCQESRINLLGKNIRDQDYLRAVTILKESGLSVGTFNMLALPGETVDHALKTVEMNVKLGVNCARRTITLPIPGTQLTQEMIGKELLDDATAMNLERLPEGEPCFKGPDSDRIETLYFLFQLLINFRILYRMRRQLVLLPPNRLTKWIGKIYAKYQEAKAADLSLLEALSFFWATLPETRFFLNNKSKY